MKYYVLEPCKSSNGFEIKFQAKIDLDRSAEVFEPVSRSLVVLLAKFGDYTLSIYSSGRIMIKSDKRMDRKDVEHAAEEITAKLEEGNAI